MVDNAKLPRNPDVDQVLALHRRWWKSNEGLDIEQMRECFARGDNFMMFNLNGFLYFSLDELVLLWEFLKEAKVDFRNTTSQVIRVESSGDMIWVAAEVQTELRTFGSDEFAPRLLRSTEIYHRDSGDGSAAWKIWHFHCSDHASPERHRLGFDDTFLDRGLGGNPYTAPLLGVQASE